MTGLCSSVILSEAKDLCMARRAKKQQPHLKLLYNFGDAEGARTLDLQRDRLAF